jgi:very-short-patch-repair endonuclease
LRRHATPAERILWSILKQVEIEGHFRRQAPVGPYFADFAHHQYRLIVELDGEQHGHAQGLAHDAKRTAYLESVGYRVLRFWNHEIRQNLHGVVETILHAVNSTPPTSSPSQPQAGGGVLNRSNTGHTQC